VEIDITKSDLCAVVTMLEKLLYRGGGALEWPHYYCGRNYNYEWHAWV